MAAEWEAEEWEVECMAEEWEAGCTAEELEAEWEVGTSVQWAAEPISVA
jgi:hypothetical protein